MAKTYRIIKTALFIAVLVLAALILIYENTRDPSKPAARQGVIGFYEKAKSILLYDPYDSEILTKVQTTKTDFKKMIFSIAGSVSNLIADKDFYNNVFIFMVSKKSEGISQMIQGEFTNIPSFLDLIIIDREKNILYKYGNSSFIADDFATTNDRDIKILDQEIAVIEKYHDNTLDYDIRIIALFDSQSIAAQLKQSTYPSFLILGNRIYKNSDSLPDILNLIQKNLRMERKYYVGLSVVETTVLTANKFYIGTLGIHYPSRSIWSILLILFKAFLAVLIIIALITLDNFIEHKLKTADWDRIQKPSRKKKRKGKIDEQNKIAEAEMDANLNWVEDYVHHAEGDKKGEKK